MSAQTKKAPPKSVATEAPEKGDEVKYKPGPPMQLAVRSADGVKVVPMSPPLDSLGDLIENGENELSSRSRDGGHLYSPDGKLLAIIQEKGVHVYDTATMKLFLNVDRPNVDKVEFSPKSTYLVTWEAKHEVGKENLYIWEVATGQVVRMFHQKDVAPKNWPPFAWSWDEKIFAQLVTNQINVYDGNKIDVVQHRLRFANVMQFSIAPNAVPYVFAVARPNIKDRPGCVAVYNYPKFDEADQVTAKTFFKADEITIKWSSIVNPSVFLIETGSFTSAGSYYGETNLYLVHADGKFDCTVPFGTETGNTQDAQWSPKGNEFIAIQGKQPCQAILFNYEKCEPIYHFGRNSQNTVRWSPQGRFVMFGGFLNLPGHMTFWDRWKKKQLGQCQDKDSPRFFEWTPDGRALITATLRPERTVANGFKVWSYYGALIHTQSYEKLYQVSIKPPGEDVYPDRPVSPRLNEKKAKAASENKLTTTKAAAYVPPGLRRLGQGPSAIMKKEETGPRSLSELQQQISGGGRGFVPGAATVAPGAGAGAGRGYIAGAGQVKQTKAQAKKQREKKKKEEEQQQAEERAKEKAAAEAAAKEEAAKARAAAAAAKEKAREEHKKQSEQAAPVDLSDPDSVARKIKALKKKMGQINQLKGKQERGEKLDSAELEKIKKGLQIQQEINKLQETLKSLTDE